MGAENRTINGDGSEAFGAKSCRERITGKSVHSFPDTAKTVRLSGGTEIVKRADIVLTSSNKLKETLIERYQVNNIQIVRNGLRGVSLYPIQSACIKEKYIQKQTKNSFRLI